MAISVDCSTTIFMWWILYRHRIDRIPTRKHTAVFPLYFLLQCLKYKTGHGLRRLVVFNINGNCQKGLRFLKINNQEWIIVLLILSQ